jgi:transcriptional regulator with XRE-family HTH domain
VGLGHRQPADDGQRPSFSARLKAHRLAARLTLEALGERAGIRQRRLSDYECGRKVPRWRALVKLVRVVSLGLVDDSPTLPH